MCGIAGLFAFGKTLPQPDQQAACVLSMTSRMLHRGPDAGGHWTDDTGMCAFGHRRLAIIDTSDAGIQPMHWHGGEWTICFNGEIYNYQELKRELQVQGVVFKGRTDTEVLLAGLSVWGEGFLPKIDGMFAFAAFHRSSGQLILARDPFGEKPLYYFQTTDGGIAFASELQCLEGVPGFSKEVSADAIGELLMFQYIGAPRTIYKNIKKLQPGHYIKVRAGELKVQRYFHFEPGQEGYSEASRVDLADELENILVTSLRRRMISDVPLGAFLSGGVDSSTVCALARRKLGVPLQTFSIGFQNDPGSEHFIARQLAAHLGTEHRDQILAPSAFDFLNHAGTLLDEPNADSSCLPTYLLSQFAKQHVTVALSGDGGDELFGGYGRYFDTLAEARAESGRVLSTWSPGRSYYCSNRIMIFNPIQLSQLLGFMPASVAEHVTQLIKEVDQSDMDILHRLRKSDIENYMPGAVLPKVDRMSMQHSMEVRSPFFNVELARFAQKLPAQYLVDGRMGKLLLRDIAYRYLPREIMDMPKKGFGLPLTAGWGQKELVSALRKSLSPDSRLGNWIGEERVQRFIRAQSTDGFSIYQAWSVIMLSNWLNARDVRMPAPGAFELFPEEKVPHAFSVSSQSPFRILGFISPKVIVVSSPHMECPDRNQPIDRQLCTADTLTLWKILKASKWEGRLSSLGAKSETHVLEGQVELAGAIKDFGIDLEGCTLISLDQNNEWIKLKDIQQLRLLKLRQLMIPARFRYDGVWIRYEFQYDSPMRRLYKLASLLPIASSIWDNRKNHVELANHYTTPPIEHISTPLDTESVFSYALFEGPSQILPFVSSHQEIYNANERRYSVWNRQVQYSMPPHSRRWFFRPLYRYNWLIPVNKRTATKLPAVAWPMPLDEPRIRYEEVLRRLVESTNECAKKNSEASFFVLYTHGLSAGGAERQWCNLAIGLKAIGKKVVIVVDSLNGVNGHYLDMVRKRGVDILDTSKQREIGRLNFLTDFRNHSLLDQTVFPVADQAGRLASVLDRLKPDAVVAQLDSTNITAGVAGLLTDIPHIVLSFRNYNPSHFDYLDSPWMLSAYHELIRSNRIVLTGNSRLGNLDYARWLGLDEQQIHLLKNSYEPDGIEILCGPEKDAFRASLQIAPENKIIFGAFRLAREKNPHLFVQTCEIVLSRHPDAIALLCGEGGMHAELEKYIQHSGLSNRIRLMGRRSDVWKFLSVADVLLLTSDKEGTPNIVKEALMLHCPVVSTACGAVPEMILEGVNGHLAEQGDVAMLSAFVEKVLYDSEHRAHLVRSMPTSAELFSPKDKAQLLLSILDGTFS